MPSIAIGCGHNDSTRSLRRGRATGGAPRPPPPTPRPRNPFHFTPATVALALVRRLLLADFQEPFSNRANIPAFRGKPAHDSHARSRRGSLIVKVTRHRLPLTRRNDPVAFSTFPFYQVSSPQRLSPLASIPAIKRRTDADSVTVSAKLYLFSSYAFAPRHFAT